MQENKTPFMVGDWLVEPALNRLSRGDEQCQLVPKVMAMLLTLAEHPDEPLSQDALMQLVWPGQVVSDSSVYQAVAQLRKALGDTAANPVYIERVSGKGYRLIAKVKPIAAEPTQAKDPRLWLVTAGLVVLLSFIVWWWQGGDDTSSVDPVASVTLTRFAVNGPQSLSAMEQVLLTHLAHVEGLKVVYRHADSTPITTDVTLGGQIQQQGQTVRVDLQLSAAESGQILWAESLEGQANALFLLQDRIAAAVLDRLGKHRSANAFAGPQVDARSFEQYLLARHLWEQRAPQKLKQAQALFEQMRAEGRLFPLAAVGLCDTYHFMTIYGDWTLPQALEKCEPLLAKALKAQPGLGEALATKARLLNGQNKIDEAEALFRQAMITAPNYAFAYMWYGNLVRGQGRFDEALTMTQKAFELSPMSPIVNRSLAYSYLTLSQLGQARYYYHRALALEPDYVGKASEQLDFMPMSVERANAFVDWVGNDLLDAQKDPYERLTLALIELALGKVGRVGKLLQNFEHPRVNESFLYYLKAAVAAQRGDIDTTIVLLRKRFVMYPEITRFAMPLVAALMEDDQHAAALDLLSKARPEFRQSNIAVTQDNQFWLTYWVYLHHYTGQSAAVAGLTERLDTWFATQTNPLLTPFLARWLVFRGQHRQARDMLMQMMTEGWLPHHNDDIFSETRMRSLFRMTELGEAEFDRLLQSNRSQVALR